MNKDEVERQKSCVFTPPSCMAVSRSYPRHQSKFREKSIQSPFFLFFIYLKNATFSQHFLLLFLFFKRRKFSNFSRVNSGQLGLTRVNFGQLGSTWVNLGLLASFVLINFPMHQSIIFFSSSCFDRCHLMVIFSTNEIPTFSDRSFIYIHMLGFFGPPVEIYGHDTCFLTMRFLGDFQ